MLSERETDVLVIGGGPGGSTTAARLSQAGLRVVLVEKTPFPRFHIGESLLPGTWALWHTLGIDMDQSGQLVKTGAKFNLFGKREFFYRLAQEAPEYFSDNNGKLMAFHVVRAEYDQLLLDNARRRGVEVVQPCTVQEVIFDGPRAVGGLLSTADGATQEVRAHVVVDATGRDSILARKLGLRHPDPKLNKIAYFAHFENAYREAPGAVPIWVLAFRGGWFWYIPLRGGITSVGLVADAEYARTRGQRPIEQFFRDTLSEVAHLQEWMASARQVGEFHTISNLSYMTDRFVGDGWLLVGDAAMFVDAIFSSGVHMATKGGLFASETITQALSGPGPTAEALAPYEQRLRAPMGVIFSMIYRWYELLRDPEESVDIFAEADRYSVLRKRVNAILGGAYERAGLEPLLTVCGGELLAERA
jgi:halogenation protein CepH